MRQIAILATLLSLTAGAQARDFLTGGDVMRICTSQKSGEETACNTYIAGLLDQLDAMPRGEVCKPSGISLRDLRMAVARYGQSHGNDVRDSGSALVNAAVKSSYPCGR